MDWHKTLKQIRSKLADAGYEDKASELWDAQLQGATGGEILDIVLTRLLNMRRQSDPASQVIHAEIDQLLTYARGIGYIRDDELPGEF